MLNATNPTLPTKPNNTNNLTTSDYPATPLSTSPANLRVQAIEALNALLVSDGKHTKHAYTHTHHTHARTHTHIYRMHNYHP